MPIEVKYIILFYTNSFDLNPDFQFLQYCEYYPDYEKCKIWMEKNLPNEFSKVKLEGEADTAGATDDDKKRQTRGGKGMLKAKKTKEGGPKKVCVSRAPRGKRKSVTVVTGLSTFGRYLNYYLMINPNKNVLLLLLLIIPLLPTHRH